MEPGKSVDGDRQDIALGKDRDEDQIRQNAWDRFHDPKPEHNYSEDGRSLSTIILEMMRGGKNHTHLYIEDVRYDMDIHEAVGDACIELGLSEDKYSPFIHKNGDTVEIYLSR